MLVKFTFDKDCFSAESLNDKLNTNSHLILDEYWSRYGVLIYPETFDRLSFLKGLKCIEDKKKWSLKLSGNLFRSLGISDNWESMEEQNKKEPRYKDLKDYKKYFQIVLLHSSHHS